MGVVRDELGVDTTVVTTTVTTRHFKRTFGSTRESGSSSSSRLETPVATRTQAEAGRCGTCGKMVLAADLRTTHNWLARKAPPDLAGACPHPPQHVVIHDPRNPDSDGKTYLFSIKYHNKATGETQFVNVAVGAWECTLCHSFRPTKSQDEIRHLVEATAPVLYANVVNFIRSLPESVASQSVAPRFLLNM